MDRAKIPFKHGNFGLIDVQGMCIKCVGEFGVEREKYPSQRGFSWIGKETIGVVMFCLQDGMGVDEMMNQKNQGDEGV